MKINTEQIPNNYNVESLMNLAMEQNWIVGRIYKNDSGISYYTLKVLTAMSFEQWARLIEIENINTNA